jgi:hypothetical protein
MRYRPLLAAGVLSIVLTGCTAPAAPVPTAPPPTSAPAPSPAPQPTTGSTAAPQSTAAPAAQQSPAEIQAGIQQALDTIDQAVADSNPELLAQAVDQENLPFRRLVSTRLERRFGTRNAPKVVSIRPRELGFVEASIEDRVGSLDWTFRRLSDGRWVLSEPTTEQVGKRQTRQTDAFIFVSHPWTDAINPAIEQLINEARAEVQTKLGKLPDSKAQIFIKPIFSMPPLESPNALAYYDRASRRGQPDRIVVFAPFSFAFGYYSADGGWQDDLKETLVHEYTHLVHDRAFTPIARLNDWMVEGLAVYISGEYGGGRGVIEAVRSDQIIPIIDPAPKNGVEYYDLEHLTILPTATDVSLGYGLAGTLVDFIVERYGGLEGFWKLAAAQDKTQKFDLALQQAFGIDYATFDGEWRAWLKQKYG